MHNQMLNAMLLNTPVDPNANFRYRKYTIAEYGRADGGSDFDATGKKLTSADKLKVLLVFFVLFFFFFFFLLLSDFCCCGFRSYVLPFARVFTTKQITSLRAK